MKISRTISTIAVTLLTSLVLMACRGGAWHDGALEAKPDPGYGYPLPSYAHIFEGANPKTLELNRSEIPIALAFVARDTSAWMILYELDGEITYYIETPELPDGVPPLQLTDATNAAVCVRVAYGKPWTVYGTFLDESIYMALPGMIQGSREQVIFFTSGVPEMIKVKADPDRGRFALMGIESPNSYSVLVSTDEVLTQTLQVPPDLLGLIIRTSGTWTLEITASCETSE